MQPTISTPRLLLTPIHERDVSLIFKLLNSPGWLEYIGDRNIRTKDDALAYINKLDSNPDFNYWSITEKNSGVAAGVITFMKRNYLEHHDIGYALLPEFTGRGFAEEGTRAVLNKMLQGGRHIEVEAIVVSDNSKSLTLLEKIGMHYRRDFLIDGTPVQIYGASVDQLCINQVIHKFFQAFDNKGQPPQLDRLRDICLPEVRLINHSYGKTAVYDLVSFITPREKILTDGTLVEFIEKELCGETLIVNNIAQHYSQYKKEGVRLGMSFMGSGTKLFQMIKVVKDWKIVSVIWEDGLDH